AAERAVAHAGLLASEGARSVAQARAGAGRSTPLGSPAREGAAMKSVEIDRGKRLKDQPSTGHNRFHPDVPPIVTVDEGEEVILPTRDGVDGQFGPGTTESDMARLEAGAIHPLTGPAFVKGARPGDVLEVEFLEL